MFSADQNCHIVGGDITRDTCSTDSIQLLSIPAKQLMYNPYFNQQYELTFSNGQPGMGEPSDEPSVASHPYFQNHTPGPTDMSARVNAYDAYLPVLQQIELKEFEDTSFVPNSTQCFDYGLPPLPISDQSPISPWSTPSSHSHTSITPLLEASSLSPSSAHSSPFSYTSSSPSPYFPTSCLFAPPNPPPASSQHSHLSPPYATHDLSPAHYPTQFPQTAFYSGCAQQGSQQGSLPIGDSGNGSRANTDYRFLTPPRLRVPQRIEAKSNDSFQVDFTIDGIPGIRLKDAVKHIDEIGLDGAHDMVFRSQGSRQIWLVLTWPGYERVGLYIPVQDNKSHLTRAKFANLISARLEKKLKWLSQRKIAPEFAPWKIHRSGISFDKLWLVSVKLAAANMWVAELEVDTA
ncbi:hypothetical protein QCA50_017277 [Cerrena zonata]|uniref:Uncharacterized protein n=1 Tax=Cerrena zonata TaxID=2478898 RepID=A0AAW0FH46_9APHY